MGQSPRSSVLEALASTEGFSNPGGKTACSKGGGLKGRTLGLTFFFTEWDPFGFALHYSLWNVSLAFGAGGSVRARRRGQRGHCISTLIKKPHFVNRVFTVVEERMCVLMWRTAPKGALGGTFETQ